MSEQNEAPQGSLGVGWLTTAAITILLVGLAFWILRPGAPPTPSGGTETVPGSPPTARVPPGPSVPPPEDRPRSPEAQAGQASPIAASPGTSSLPPQDYRAQHPVPAAQARMIKGYCEAMYALRDDGKVDVNELEAADTSAMAAKDAGEYDRELEFNKKAYSIAHDLLEKSFEENLARGLASASPDFRAVLEENARAFRNSLKTGDMFDAATRYRSLMELLNPDPGRGSPPPGR